MLFFLFVFQLNNFMGSSATVMASAKIEISRHPYNDWGVSIEHPWRTTAFPRSSSWRLTALPQCTHGILDVVTARPRHSSSRVSLIRPFGQAVHPTCLHYSPSTQPQKKAKTVTDLTAAQGDDLPSWLEVNPHRLHPPCAQRDSASDATEIDHWILQSFAWPRVHVVEVKKITVSTEENIAAAASAEDVADDQSETPTETETASRQRLEPLSPRSSASSTKKANQEEGDYESLGDDGSPKVTGRTPCADWVKEVMASLHPPLWLNFPRECTSLLYTQEKSEELLHPAAQQQRYPAQQLQYPAKQQQYQAYPKTSPAPRPPAQCGSISLSSGLQLSSRTVCVGVAESRLADADNDGGPWTFSARPIRHSSTSTLTQSAEPSLNFLSLVNNSIDMCETSSNRAVATLDDCMNQKKE
ncbi:hypothetical protein ScPMuIL_002999 [Solemya velum]